MKAILLSFFLVSFVMTSQTAYAVGVDVLKNGTLVIDNRPPGPAINSTTGLPGNMTDPPIATNEVLVTDPEHSWRWNSGYAYGYLQKVLPDLNHTREFLQGYRNGSEDILYNQGYVAGCSNLTYHGYKKHVLSYRDGYADGQRDAGANIAWSACVSPAHTDDNQLTYYIGFHDGMRAIAYSDESGLGGDFRYSQGANSR